MEYGGRFVAVCVCVNVFNVIQLKYDYLMGLEGV